MLKNIFYSVIALFLIATLMPLKILLRRTIVTCRINARYFGHLGMNTAIASSLSFDKKLIILASIIRPVINSKLKEVTEKELYIVHDTFLQVFEKVYDSAPDKIRSVLSKFAHPIIDSKDELREFGQFSSLSEGENSWKHTFWATVNRAEHVKDVGILVALRTYDYHGVSDRKNLESYRNTSALEVTHILEAAAKNSSSLPVTFYGSAEFFEKYIEPSTTLCRVKFFNPKTRDVLELFPSTKLLINSGNGIGAVASVAELKVLYVKHSPWHAWHTFQESGLVVPASYTVDNSNVKTISELCKIALNTPSNMPFDYARNFLVNSVKLLPLDQVNLQIFIRSIDESLNLDRSLRVIGSHKGISFMYSSQLEKYFWEQYVNNMPRELRRVHTHIRIPIAASFLESYIKGDMVKNIKPDSVSGYEHGGNFFKND
jgi:hypothetical protein